MRRFLYGFSAVLFLDGFWTHDWRMILAAGSVAAIWPLISAEVEGDEESEREELLEALWSDEPEPADVTPRSDFGI